MSADKPLEGQAMRQNLVDEAVKFLSNPNVARHADDQKSAFLKKKGLNEDEIQIAFSKAKQNIPVASSSSLVPVGPTMPVAAYPLPTPPSIWVKIRDLCNFVLILTGASYGAYHLYKNYIGPLLTGRKQKTIDESMIELQQSVVSVLKEVQTTLHSLEKTLSAQNVRIESLGSKEDRIQKTSQQLEELKTEITSIKGLLINRRTFPSTPSPSQSIPSWQRTKTPEKTLEDVSVSVSTLPAQDEEILVVSEEIPTKVGKQNGEMNSDVTSKECSINTNDANEDDSDPSSSRENGHSAGGESFSPIESTGDVSSDEMSQ